MLLTLAGFGSNVRGSGRIGQIQEDTRHAGLRVRLFQVRRAIRGDGQLRGA